MNSEQVAQVRNYLVYENEMRLIARKLLSNAYPLVCRCN